MTQLFGIEIDYILIYEHLVSCSAQFLDGLASYLPPVRLGFLFLALIGALSVAIRIFKITRFIGRIMKREEGVRADWSDFADIPGAQPKKKLVSKEKKGLRTKTPLKRGKPLNRSKKGRKRQDTPYVKERILQNYLEERAISKAIPFMRVPDEVLKWIYANPDTPHEVISAANEYLRGFPDAALMKPIEGTNLCVTLMSELKTGHHNSKLKRSQKEYIRGLNFVVPRSKEEIDEALQEFLDFTYTK